MNRSGCRGKKRDVWHEGDHEGKDTDKHGDRIQRKSADGLACLALLSAVMFCPVTPSCCPPACTAIIARSTFHARRSHPTREPFSFALSSKDSADDCQKKDKQNNKRSQHPFFPYVATPFLPHVKK